MSRTSSAVVPRWDSATIVEVLRAEALDSEFSALLTETAAFAERYRTRVAELNEEDFEIFLGRYQDFVCRVQRITSYAELATTDDGAAIDASSVLARCDSAWSGLSRTLDFVEPEIATLKPPIVRTHAQLNVGGQLHHFYSRVKEMGSWDDEIRDVLSAVQPLTLDGWQRLGRQLFTRITYEEPSGSVGVSQVMSRLRHPDRGVRSRAQRDMTLALDNELELRATTLSMIVTYGLIRSDLTDSSWLEASVMSDQILPAELEVLIDCATAAYPLVHRYFELKTQLLTTPMSDEADRYAPLGDDPGGVSWPEAVAIVLDSFDAVDPSCGEAARTLLRAGRVDASERPSKPSRPFTKSVPGELPWLSVSFDGSLRQVLLLAHELGHGVHMMMASHLPILAASIPRILGETVALFFEAATFRRLTVLRSGESALSALAARCLEDQLVVPCRQVAILRFEQDLRTAHRSAGHLDASVIGELWLLNQRQLYGHALQLSDRFATWWSCLEGPFQAPGSSYAYVYGQFAAATLMEQYDAAPREFGAKLISLMSAGGTAAPRDLLLLIGVDPLSPDTWNRALASLQARLDALDTMIATARESHAAFEDSTESSRDSNLHTLGGG